jgi:uncharacterized protein YoxC
MPVWDFVAGADWRLMSPEYVALTIGAFVVVALLIRGRLRISKRMETIEAGLSKMQSEIATILQVQAALITKNATSKAEIDQLNTPIKMTGGDIAGQSMSPSTTSSQPGSAAKVAVLKKKPAPEDAGGGAASDHQE